MKTNKTIQYLIIGVFLVASTLIYCHSRYRYKVIDHRSVFDTWTKTMYVHGEEAYQLK